MRDIALVTAFLVVLALALRHPAWGALSWAGFGILNPHRHTWGFAYSLPYANGIFLFTLLGALLSREPKQLKGGAATGVYLVFVAYIAFTTLFALFPNNALPMLDKVVKVHLGTLLVLLLLYRKEHVIALVWVVAGSIGFYAIKGGVFTLTTLGQFRVWGPAGSFIMDNNAMALAAVVSIPLWAYLYTQYSSRPWVKAGILCAIVLTAVSALGSHSRGAVVAIVAMAGFLWLKSRNKVATGILLAILAALLVGFMPEAWEARVATIMNPRDDASANGRLVTWEVLWELAKDRPLVGGGFQPYDISIVKKYAPHYDTVHSAHSIYFQVLGENGFVALFLFLLFWGLVWRMCSQVAAMTRGRNEDHWAYWLAQMTKVSLVAFLVGGAFLNLAHWDLPYYLFAGIAVTRFVLVRQRTVSQGDTRIPAAAGEPALTITTNRAARTYVNSA